MGEREQSVFTKLICVTLTLFFTSLCYVVLNYITAPLMNSHEFSSINESLINRESHVAVTRHFNDH